MNAKTASELHAKRRLVQRYGLRLSVEELRQVVTTIQMGRAVPLRKQTHSRTLFAVQLGRDETWVPVVYSSSRKAIVTVLPENVLTKHLPRSKPQSTPPATKQAATVTENATQQQPAVVVEQRSTPATPQPIQPLFRLEQDRQIDRFKMVATDPKCKPKTELYFREELGRKYITYARSKRLCAAGKQQILAMFKQQLNGWFPKACKHLELELQRVGLSWEPASVVSPTHESGHVTSAEAA